MSEVWLQSNRRALMLTLVPPALGLAIGGAVAILGAVSAVRWLGMLVAAISALLAVGLVWQLGRPRLARQDDHLLFYLRAGNPVRVPLGLVEGFLLGQGPSYLPTHQSQAAQAATVVVRLAERAEEFARRDVRPSLGAWCNHYVTIRGTWCEPLSVALVNRLNERLAAVHATQRNERGRS